MYLNVSDDFKRINAETGRTFRAKLVMTASNKEVTADIISMKMSGGNSSAEDLSFGDVSAATAEIEFSCENNIENIVKADMTAKLSIGLLLSSGYEYVPMGEYKVLPGKKNGAKFSVSLADKLYNSDTAYLSGLVYPTTANNIVREICNDLGISNYSENGTDLSKLSFSSMPLNVTKRQMLSYIASYFGKSVYIDRNGVLTFGWYDFDNPVPITDDEIAEPTIGETIKIEALACATDSETVLTSGTGRAITFSNPFMTQAQLNTLAKSLTPKYVPAEINQLVGNILVDRFDVLEYKDRYIPIMSSELTFDGGVSMLFKSEGKTEEEAASKTVTELDVILEKVKRYADDAIKNTTDIMNGTNGGYKINKYDADGNPYATLWMNAPDEKTATNCIMISKNGFGFGSKKEGAADWTFVWGWTIDGSFNTEYITSHNLSLTGSLTDGKRTNVENTDIDMHYELSPNLELYSKDGKKFEAVGLKAYSQNNGIRNNSYYTNYGTFFDAAGGNSALDTVVSALISILGNMNYYSNGGFHISDGKNEINGSPYVGFSSTKGFYDNDIRCLTEETGVNNCLINGYLADCNSPSVSISTNNRICVDRYNSGSAHSPFSGSVGYLVTLIYFNSSNHYIVQFGIRYRDNQIKMRTYNKVNSNSDGKTPAWSDWSNVFVTQNVTDALTKKDAELNTKIEDVKNTLLTYIETEEAWLKYEFTSDYNSGKQQGYEFSLSGCLTQWGTATATPSGTQITFDESYNNSTYGISITPFGSAGSVWFTAPSTTGFKIWASKETPVRWMTTGI